MNFLWLLFGFSGRIPRSRFWIGQLIMAGMVMIGVVMFGAIAAGLSAGAKPGMSGGALLATLGVAALPLIAIVIVGLWVNAALSIKRLHDRGKPGIFYLIMMGPGILNSLSPFVFGIEASMSIMPILTLIAAAGNIWWFIECGCLPGDTAENLYGPPNMVGGGGGGAAAVEQPSLAFQSAEAALEAINAHQRSMSSGGGQRSAPAMAKAAPQTSRAGVQRPAGFGRRTR